MGATVNPAALAQLALARRQLGTDPTAADVSSPVSPSLNDQAAQQIMAASQQAQHMQQGLYDQGGAQEAQRRALLAQQAQQAQAAVPHFGAMMRPVTGQGIGHDILNGLRDVGVGALAVGSATVPGQAIESALYAPQRAQLAATSRALASTEKAEQPTASEFGAVSSEQARPFGALAETGHTAQQAVQFEKTNARLIQQMQNQFDVAMSRIATTKDIATKRMAIQQELGHLMAQVKLRGIAAGLDMNTATNEARIAGANILANSRFASDHDLLTVGENLLGMAPNAPTANIYPGTPNPPPAQPREEGSTGRSASPARPKGVPAGAIWNPSTRTWQLHK